MADATIDPWLSEDTHRVLDLCTGNGSLAVIAAMTYPDVQVDAADISGTRWRWPASTSSEHALADRITLIESDGLAALPWPLRPDCVQSTLCQRRQHGALAGRIQGRAGAGAGRRCRRHGLHVAPCCCASGKHMNRDAVLVLEIGNERENFERAFPALTPLWLKPAPADDQVPGADAPATELIYFSVCPRLQ
jgi:ribosomal protein L3 glutamine methyltransferase